MRCKCDKHREARRQVRCKEKAKARMGGYCQDCRWHRRITNGWRRNWGDINVRDARWEALHPHRLRRQRSLYRARRR